MFISQVRCSSHFTIILGKVEISANRPCTHKAEDRIHHPPSKKKKIE